MEHELRFDGRDGTPLFARIWQGARDRTDGRSVVLVHGAFEHSGRYAHVGARLALRGHTVIAMDLRGHGLSGGARMYVERFDAYLDDLDDLLRAIDRRGVAPTGAFVLLGHSMGGLVALAHALRRPPSLAGLALSAPWLRLSRRVAPAEAALAPLLSAVWPRLSLPSGIAPESLSRDPEVGRAYLADPLVSKTATVRWFVQCTRAARACLDGRASSLAIPVLLLQGDGDSLVDPGGARELYRQLPPSSAVARFYPGLRHELFNEPEREQVLEDVAAWFDRLP